MFMKSGSSRDGASRSSSNVRAGLTCSRDGNLASPALTRAKCSNNVENSSK